MIKRRCRDCRNDYSMTEAEIAKFEKQHLTVPGRCTICRRLNRLTEEVKLLKRKLQANAVK